MTDARQPWIDILGPELAAHAIEAGGAAPLPPPDVVELLRSVLSPGPATAVEIPAQGTSSDVA